MQTTIGGLRGYRADVAFDGERMVPGGALVLVDGATIVGVEAGRAAAPADCQVTYLPGATLLPGLIDAHVHLCGDSGPRALDQLPELDRDALDTVIDSALAAQLVVGVTAVRDLGDVGWAAVERRDTEPGQPWVVASGPPLTSVGGHCSNMGGGVAGRDALIRAVRERAERGVDVVKIMTSGGLMTPGTDVLACNFTLDELRVVVDETHRLGLPITAHAHALPAVQQSVEAGVDGIEHCTCFTGQGLHTPPELVERIAAADITVCPTLGRDPSMTAPPPHLQALLDRLGLRWEDRLPQVRHLYDGGVRLISGADSGINPGKPHGVLPHAIINLVEVGATPVEALASATGRAADACGLADRTGRLQAGLAADLVFLDGDATSDITAVRSLRGVIARGREIRIDIAPDHRGAGRPLR